MSLVTYTLQAAEHNAERAGAQELRARMKAIRAMCPSLDEDTLDYARALLLKLGRLVDEQTVEFA